MNAISKLRTKTKLLKRKQLEFLSFQLPKFGIACKIESKIESTTTLFTKLVDLDKVHLLMYCLSYGRKGKTEPSHYTLCPEAQNKKYKIETQIYNQEVKIEDRVTNLLCEFDSHRPAELSKSITLKMQN